MPCGDGKSNWPHRGKPICAATLGQDTAAQVKNFTFTGCEGTSCRCLCTQELGHWRTYKKPAGGLRCWCWSGSSGSALVTQVWIIYSLVDSLHIKNIKKEMEHIAGLEKDGFDHGLHRLFRNVKYVAQFSKPSGQSLFGREDTEIWGGNITRLAICHSHKPTKVSLPHAFHREKNHWMAGNLSVPSATTWRSILGLEKQVILERIESVNGTHF